jgi:hypothetical protein
MQSQFQPGTLAPPHTHRELRRILLIFATIWATLLGGGVKFSVVRADSSAGPTGGYAFLPSQFAMADFDGDIRPDLASIESTPSGSAIANYSIQLRLTKAGVQSLSLVAPAGGLWIEARDVNGDHAVDLIFATAWLNQPVAVLLNDGHGRFSRAKPEAFPTAFRGPSRNCRLLRSHLTDPFSVLVPSSASRTSLAGFAYPLPASRWSYAASSGLSSNLPLSSHRGRAPPRAL